METRGVDQVHAVEPADSTGNLASIEAPAAPLSGAVDAPSSPDFRAVFAAHFPYVWHTLRRLGVPARDLEDVTHDVFLELHRHYSEYEPGRALRPWIFAFAFRVGSHYLRRARHRYEALVDADTSDGAPSPLERVVASESLDIAHAALASIEVNRRAVFLLHEVDGCSIPEVAAALGVPLNTAYSRLRLARREFRERVRLLRERGRRA